MVRCYYNGLEMVDSMGQLQTCGCCGVIAAKNYFKTVYLCGQNSFVVREEKWPLFLVIVNYDRKWPFENGLEKNV
jgi:hypothetical protein